ncbi:MAG: hypothetical protein ACO3CV_07955 [Steroidobacteraceae bacterium]
MSQLEAWVECPGLGWWLILRVPGTRRRRYRWVGRRALGREAAAAWGRALRSLARPGGYTADNLDP